VRVGEVKDYAPLDTVLHRIAGEFERLAKEFPDSSFSVKHRGHYYHDGCTQFDFSLGDDITEEQENRCGEAEDELAEAARDFMRWIYRQLEKEWEWQNSDEHVDETIVANEYTFDEQGGTV